LREKQRVKWLYPWTLGHGGSKMMIQKSALLSLLGGYKKANELIVEEKRKRLALLTTEESFSEYIALCELAEEGVKSEALKSYRKKG